MIKSKVSSLSNGPQSFFSYVMIALFLCSGVSFAQTYNALFFSSVDIDMPTVTDSVTITSSGYFPLSGKVVDSSFSINDNRISIGFRVYPDTTLPLVKRVSRKIHLGKLSAGEYQIITTTQYADTNAVGSSLNNFSDTTHFRVIENTKAVPKIVSQWVTSGSVPENSPVSYYYWNGDTLSIAVAFSKPDMPGKFATHMSIVADTINLTIIDTTASFHAMRSSYLVIASVAPLSRKKYCVATHFERRSAKPYKLYDFHKLIVDDTQEALALSMKKAGRTDFLLFPLDYETTTYPYVIYSPLLDTLRLMSFGTNPSCTTVIHPEVYLGDIIGNGYEVIEDWEMFVKGEWHSLSNNSVNMFLFDTINYYDNHYLRVSVGSDSKKVIRGSLYRLLDSVRVVTEPSISMDISFNPLITKVDKIDNSSFVDFRYRSLPNVRYLPHSIQVSFPLNRGYGGVTKNTDFSVKLIDIRGRIVKNLQSNPDVNSSSVGVTWDRKDANGNFAPGGSYFLVMRHKDMLFKVKIQQIGR